MNVARLWFYGGAIDNTSIVAPGGDNPPGIEINDNEQLTASWAVRAPLPFVSRGPFAVSDGTFVYIGGGYDGSTVHADLLRYDPVANTYTPLAPSTDSPLSCRKRYWLAVRAARQRQHLLRHQA